MSRRARFAATAATLLAVWAAPKTASAHALGQSFQLPVPLWLYLAGAAIAVAASFLVTGIVARPSTGAPSYPALPLPEALTRPVSVALRALGLIWWLGAIAAGLLLGETTPVPAVLFWIGIWVGLPIATVTLGNPWPSFSPFRTIFAGLEGLARPFGVRRLDVGLAYPAALARWPAVFLLFAAIWSEFVLPASTAAPTVTRLLLGYTVVTLLGTAVFGRIAWLRNAELFEVLLGWYGRVGPIGRRTVAPEACDGCSEGCDPRRCIDCAECAIVAEPGERRVELRPWFAGLTEVHGAGWSDAAVIVLALAGVSYDGLRETAIWGGALNAVFPALIPFVGPFNAILLADTLGLLTMWLGFLAAFGIALKLTRSPRLGAGAGTYAATLLPIAAGYLIAHYLTVVIQGVAWLPELLANPITSVAPPVDWIPISAVWYLSVGAIVVGHIAAVVLAHRIALREAQVRPILAGVPLVVLMVGYTILSLWIIAQPIVIEPNVTPSAILVTDV